MNKNIASRPDFRPRAACTAATMASAVAMGLVTTGIVLLPALGHATEVGQAAQASHAVKQAARVPLAAGAIAGRFEGEIVKTPKRGTMVINHDPAAGWGWTASSDQRMNGHSSASISLIHPGANGSKGALRIRGELQRGFIAPWAGAVWFPGSEPMQPADLSASKRLQFQARGKPGSYTIMLMAGSPRSIPQYASFQITDHWKQYDIPLASSFPGANLSKVYFITFSAATWGQFHFDLDQVRLRGPHAKAGS